MAMRQRCAGTGFGESPLDERRLLDWQALYGQAFTAWEIDAIFMLDALWLRSQQEARSAAE